MIAGDEARIDHPSGRDAVTGPRPRGERARSAGYPVGGGRLSNAATARWGESAKKRYGPTRSSVFLSPPTRFQAHLSRAPRGVVTSMSSRNDSIAASSPESQLGARYERRFDVRPAVTTDMRNLYHFREIEAPDGSPQMKLLRAARFDAAALVEIARGRAFGVPTFVVGALLLPAFRPPSAGSQRATPGTTGSRPRSSASSAQSSASSSRGSSCAGRHWPAHEFACRCASR